MQTLNTVVANPSGLDSLSNYIGETEFSDFEVLLTRSRDSDLLTESNFQTALEMLGGESESVVINRFGHWACGWWESLSVKPNTPQYDIAKQIEANLADYPVLDDQDFYEKESEEAQSIWSSCYNEKERIAYIRQHRSQFDFNSWEDLRNVIRGQYFNGYESELIN